MTYPDPISELIAQVIDFFVEILMFLFPLSVTPNAISSMTVYISTLLVYPRTLDLFGITIMPKLNTFA